MKKLLFINACVSDHSPSRTKVLCDAFLDKYQGRWEIEEIILEKAGLYPFTKSMLQNRERCLAAQDFSSPAFDYAQIVAAADMIVIGAPHWDLSFPSLLKVFVEHIMVNGITFHYVDSGSEGLCQADRLVYITTAGGFLPTPDWGYGYMKAIGNMLGISQVDLLVAEGLDIAGADVDAIMETALTKARQ